MEEVKLSGESMNIVEDNIEKLKSIFPDVFTEGKVDFDKLQEILGNYIEKKEERYNFTWNGKSAALRLAQTPSTGTLRPCKEESKDWDTTENLYIEGDNLEVLKLLQKSYHNKIKMIYIDPPYNTGNDFVYKDDFKDNLDNYKKITGQVDDDGNKISTNSESDGRYHTNWLNMMYPRLRLARNLLSDDGVIFISIDDNEIDNLKKVCNEIFGEDNYIATFPRLTTKSGKTPLTYMISHDYILCYVKTRKDIFVGKLYADNSYKFEDEYIEERGRYNLKQPLDCNSISYSKSLDYPIEHNGKIYYPGGDYDKFIERKNGKFLPKDYAWRWSKDLFEFGLKNGWIVFSENNRIYTKGYLNATIEKNSSGEYYIEYREKTRKMSTIDFIDNAFSNDIAKKQLASYNIDAKFDYPKPINMLKEIISSYYKKDAIVLDFFSGSATIADSLFELNNEDQGNRKFILVQLPEKILDNKNFNSICDIGKERIRRSGEKIKEEIESNNTQLKLGEEPKKVPDIGFKVFKLDTSNIKKWNGNADTIESEIQGSIFNYEVGRSELDVVYEIMLKCGLDLTYPIEEINVNGKTLYSIGAGAMFVCMDNDITQDIADKIVEIKDANDIIEPVAVFKDNGFTTDSNKTNIKEALRVAGIKDFITV